MGTVGGVLRGRLDVVEQFSDFVYLFTEADSPESYIEQVPNGVAAAVDGMLAVPVATDTSPLRVRLESHDRHPPALDTGVQEDIAVLTWRPLGQQLRLGDTVGHEVDGLDLGAGGQVLAVEVRCRRRDEAASAGVGEIEEPVEEIVIRMWPGPAPGGDAVTRRSGFARMLAGDPPPPSGPAAPVPLGETVPMPVCYHRFYLRDEGVPAPWEQKTLELSGARVNGLVSNLPGLAEVSTGTPAGEVDLCARVVDRDLATVTDALAAVAGPAGLPATADAVAVTHRTGGAVLVTDIEDYADHYRFAVPVGEVGLLVVAWDRDMAARRSRNAKARERIDLVFWAGETPGELVIQAASTFGREMAADAERTRRQLAQE
jgi:hypothetical protein